MKTPPYADLQRRVALGALAVPLAVLGQWVLGSQRLVVAGLAILLLAIGLFALAVLPGSGLVRPAGGDGVERNGRERTSPWRLRLGLLAAAACAVLAWLFSGGNRFRPETIGFWVLACGLYLWALWERRSSGGPSLAERARSLLRQEPRITWPVVGLALVMLMAAFFRYYELGGVPGEMTSDHAEKLLDVRDVLNGEYRIFFPRNTGREPLQFYLAVPFVEVFGLGHLALKGLTATVSLLAVPVVYLIGKEIGGARYGLLAAFFLAISKWDVGIARVGLRFPFNPFFVALAFLFLLRGLRRRSRNDFLLCGLVTGVGLYSYIPFRAMPLLILAAVAAKIALDTRQSQGSLVRTLRDTAACFGAVAVVLIPLAHFAVESPHDFWYRALTRVADVEMPIPQNPASVLLGNLINAAGMFNWRGDMVWVNTVPWDPHLDFVSGGLFLLGVVWCFSGLVKRREAVAAYLLIALLVMMMPSVLSITFPAENPSVVRAGGTTPIVALLVAAPLCVAVDRLAAVRSGATGRWVAVVGLALLMAVAARANYDRYFHDYATQYRRIAMNTTEIVGAIDGFARSVGSLKNAYVVSYPYWVDFRLVAIGLGDPDWDNELMSPADLMRHSPAPGNKLYVLNGEDSRGVQVLRDRFPEGQVQVFQSATPGKDFLTFFVPAVQ